VGALFFIPKWTEGGVLKDLLVKAVACCLVPFILIAFLTMMAGLHSLAGLKWLNERIKGHGEKKEGSLRKT
jgi:hypothetical protein